MDLRKPYRAARVPQSQQPGCSLQAQGHSQPPSQQGTCAGAALGRTPAQHMGTGTPSRAQGASAPQLLHSTVAAHGCPAD
eukprot:13351945-Alexandrium_andersonii.AAC.1